DDAGAEELLPRAVGGDAGGERILAVDEPFREAEAIVRSICFKRRKRGGDVGGNPGALGGVESAFEDVGFGGLILVFAHDEAERTALLDCTAGRADGIEFLEEVERAGIFGGEEVIEKRGGLFLRAGFRRKGEEMPELVLCAESFDFLRGKKAAVETEV